MGASHSTKPRDRRRVSTCGTDGHEKQTAGVTLRVEASGFTIRPFGGVPDGDEQGLRDRRVPGHPRLRLRLMRRRACPRPVASPRRRARPLPLVRRPRPPRLSAQRRCGAHPPRNQILDASGGRRSVESGAEALRAPRHPRGGARTRPRRSRMPGGRRRPRTGARAPGGAGVGNRCAIPRRVRAHIQELYPACPEPESLAIAEHACAKYSGRVGRSAAAKQFAPETIDLAVRAHVRHAQTRYDRLLGSGWERHEARSSVALEVEHVLARWRAAPS